MKKDEELSIEEQIAALNRILSKDLVAVTYQYEAEIGKGFFSFEVKMPGEAENEFFFMTVPIDLPTQGVVERYKYPFFREALPGTREYMLIMEDAEKLRDFLMGKGTKKAMNHTQKVREIHPQVHCITNVITVNDCANALLAVGAVPIMSHHPLEVADVAKRSNALVLNMGAMESLEAMKIAGKAAKEAGIPIVLDPVGAGGANYRREKTLEIMETVHPDCIRGNLSELRALAMNASTTRGVEAEKEANIDFGMLRALSQKWNAIIVASGETDYVVDGEACVAVSGGSSYMPKVTGTGCMSSTLLGASLAVERSVRSVAACLKAISNCAERAERKTKEADGGTMSFRMYFIDELSKMS